MMLHVLLRWARMAGFVSILAFSAHSLQAQKKGRAFAWPELIQMMQDGPTSADVDDIVEQAAAIANDATTPVVRRAHSLEEIAAGRTPLDERVAGLEGDVLLVAALALDDVNKCRLLSEELPTLAAAYRITGRPDLRDRVIAQLREMTTWKPLQRTGWQAVTPYFPTPPPMPERPEKPKPEGRIEIAGLDLDAIDRTPTEVKSRPKDGVIHIDGMAIDATQPAAPDRPTALSPEGTHGSIEIDGLDLTSSFLPPPPGGPTADGSPAPPAKPEEPLPPLPATPEITREVFGDGPWLATGLGIRAITDTLEIMPPDSIPADLKAELQVFQMGVLSRIGAGWRLRYAPYMAEKRTDDLGWIASNEAAVRISLSVGRQLFRGEFDSGVRNLLSTCQDAPTDGSWKDGPLNSVEAGTAIASTARALAARGDFRLQRHSFLTRLTDWHTQQFLPAHLRINAGINPGMCPVDSHDAGLVQLFSLLSLGATTDTAPWVLTQILSPDDTLLPVAARAGATRMTVVAPQLRQIFERDGIIVWRDSWSPFGTAVWLKTGAPSWTGHADIGHINFIHKGSPILIEGGAPPAGYVGDSAEFSGAAVHNVPQIGLHEPTAAEFPIARNQFDEEGGRFNFAGQDAYPQAGRWNRDVKWTASEIVVRDQLTVSGAQREHLIFRWNLATDRPVTIENIGSQRFVVSWPNGRISIDSSVPLEVSQRLRLDFTMIEEPGDSTPHSHTCIEVKSANQIRSIATTTRIQAL